MGYKNFHFYIKIIPLDLTKIQQHNDCTVVKPEIQKSPVKKNKLPIFSKIHLQSINSQYFPKFNYNHKGPLVLIKIKVKDQSNKISSQPVFLKTMHAYFTKDIYTYTISKSKYILFNYISIPYIKFYIIGHKSPTYIDNKMMTSCRPR